MTIIQSDYDVSNGFVIWQIHEEKIGYSTPNYSFYASNGIVPPMSNLTKYFYEYASDDGTIEWDDGSLHPVHISQLDFSRQFNIPSLEDDAKAQALKKIYGTLADVDLQSLVTTAEAPKAFGLIADTAANCGRAFKSIRRGDILGAMKYIGLNDSRKANRMRKGMQREISSGRDLLQAAGSRWLELQYGWKPLLGEIESSVLVLDKQWAKNDADLYVKGRGKSSRPASTSSSKAQYRFKGKLSYEAKYYSKWRILDASQRTASSLGLTNLASVAWELIPYSFVVDWFLPVGSWIEAQTAMAGLTHVETCLGVKYDYEHLLYVDFAKNKQNQWKAVGLAETVKFDDYVRTVLPALPNPGHMLRLKSIPDALNLTRATSALALLQNAFRR